jgi:hypothetical protein
VIGVLVLSADGLQAVQLNVSSSAVPVGTGLADCIDGEAGSGRLRTLGATLDAY